MTLSRLVLFLILVLNFVFGKAQNRDSVMALTNVSLITCDPGSDLYSLFGHSAVRIKNKTKNYDIVYNYGTFDFRTPGFLIKFMRGKLPYKLSADGFGSFLAEYIDDKRGVREQLLNISNDEKLKIISFLENNALPENAFYKYDFFYDNCSTRIRDGFQKTLNYDTNYTSKEKVSLRDLLHQYLTGSLWTRLGIDMIIGSRADIDATPSYQMFLPDKLHDILGNHIINGKQFLDKSYPVLIFNKEREDRKIPHPLSPYLVNTFLTLLAIFLLYRKNGKLLNIMTSTWMIIAFIASIIILLLWFATDHQACTLNWNILWLNPLYGLLFFRKFKYKKQVIYVLIGLTALCVVNKFLPIIPQNMPAWQLSFSLVLLVWAAIKEN